MKIPYEKFHENIIDRNCRTLYLCVIENRIEVAAQMSNAGSRQAGNCMKGNRRRTDSSGRMERGDMDNIHITPSKEVALLLMEKNTVCDSIRFSL